MSSLLWGSALKALGDGGAAASQSLARSDEVDRKLAAEAEIKRERMQLDRDIAGMRYGEGGAGGGGGSRGGSKGNVFGFKTVDEAAAAGVGIKPEDIPALEAGTYGEKVTPLQGPADEMGNGPGSISNMTPGLKALNASKLGELNALRKTLVVGGGSDYKGMAEGLLIDQERGNLADFKAGNVQAGKVVMVSRGKNLFDATNDSVTDVITGANKTTAVGDADIKKKQSEVGENNAQAGKASAEAKKVNAEVLAGGGVKGATVEKLATQLSAVNRSIDGLLSDEARPRYDAKPEVKQAHADSLALYRNIQSKIAKEMDSRIGGEPAASPVEAKKPAKIDTLPAGAKQIGTSNGKPVYETPDGRRFRAD